MSAVILLHVLCPQDSQNLDHAAKSQWRSLPSVQVQLLPTDLQTHVEEDFPERALAWRQSCALRAQSRLGRTKNTRIHHLPAESKSDMVERCTFMPTHAC
jgi:hypothetical protein